MEFFYLLFILFYPMALWSMERHWRRKRTYTSHKEYGGTKAILVPFRNEAEHLPRLLINLEKILPSLQEVVFIDDGSTDDSAAMVSVFIRERNFSHWVLVQNSGVGKKAALTTGVHFTQSE